MRVFKYVYETIIHFFKYKQLVSYRVVKCCEQQSKVKRISQAKSIYAHYQERIHFQ